MPISIDAAQPDLYQSLVPDFFDISWKSRSALSLSEQLYTAKGSQSVGVGQYVAETTSTDPKKHEETILM